VFLILILNDKEVDALREETSCVFEASSQEEKALSGYAFAVLMNFLITTRDVKGKKEED
jgi:hypothetical protein